MRVPLFCTTAALLLSASAVAAPIEASGKIETVTLYRGEALVSRSVPFEAGAGPVELVVGGLPEHVVADSLSASGDEGIEVRAVRFRARAVGQAPRDDIRKLDAKLEELAEALRGHTARLKLIEQKSAYLSKLESFTVPSAKLEMSRGVLNAETLKGVTLFIFEQRATLLTERETLDKSMRATQRAIELASRQRSRLATGFSKTVREAIVFVDKRGPGAGRIRLNYLVKQASWTPFYNLRAGGDRTQVDLQYNATVQQRCGEDWTGVKLVLSTASPRLRANGPELAPFSVSLTGSQQKQVAMQQEKMLQSYANVQRNLKKAQSDQQLAQGVQRANQQDWEVNKWANEAQNLELNADEQSIRQLRRERTDEGISVSYAIDGRVSLASRPDPQMIQIARKSLPSQFFHVAVPVLSRFVYRHAEVTNAGEVALLGGNVSAYLDGRFVGKGEMLDVAPGQVFTVGFGTDTQLKVTRELVSKGDSVKGGNRQMRFDYRLTVENYKSQPVALRLYDRIPRASRPEDIEITLLPLKVKLSKDALYVRDERPRGLLRWDVSAPAKANGSKAYSLEYGYTVEFDRKYQVYSPTRQLEAQLREEFDKMRQRRYRK